MGWKIKELMFSFQQGQKTFSFSKAYRSAVGPTQPPIQGLTRLSFSEGKAAWGVKLTTHSCLVL
jgi:hypothetical protein